MSLYESGNVVKELVFDATDSKHSDWFQKITGSNPLLGMTFGVSHKITSVCLDIVRGQFAVFSISTGILGIVMEILGGSCTLTFNIAFLN